MDISKLRLFGMAHLQQGYLDQRQKVLSQNIANADTPGYRPSDLKALEFGRLVRDSAFNVRLSRTSDQHLVGARGNADQDFKAVKDRATYEEAPDHNAVILEEQLMKVSDVQNQQDLNTKLYRKYLAMLRLAITGRGST
ncbi:MAG: flagellar basal body rod protein FlgB [Proteobacteria bacterium]|nr:flagellar basal body rod protein FlgB [Pseudomonadota bacterium]